MPRRPAYTEVVRHNERRALYVEGQSDRLYRLVSCLGLDCPDTFVVSQDAAEGNGVITCPTCGYEHQRGRTTKFFDYELVLKESHEILGEGPFEISHDAYLDAAPIFKYCIICSSLQPVANFHRHASRESRLQGECRVCKKAYNELKNGSRLPEQHREAADYRRMMIELAPETGDRLDLSGLYSHFEGQCFNCEKELIDSTSADNGYRIDHTLPAKFLWPLSTGPTLMCRACNGAKAEKWPSEFYDSGALRRLAVVTGIEYELLAGPAHYNPDAMEHLKGNADDVIEKWIAYAPRLRQLRERILKATGTDVFATATHIPSSITLDGEKPR